MARPKAASDYDAVVVGSGPNGLAAAIAVQRAGKQVLVLEAASEVGGGMRTAEITLPGFHHDLCSAVHPLAAASPFFNTIPLREFGLEFIHPEILLAHPFDREPAAVIYKSIEKTTAALGDDGQRWNSLLKPILKNNLLTDGDILAPLHFPRHPVAFARFGLKAIRSAEAFSKIFSAKSTKALWSGLAAHSGLALDCSGTNSFAIVLAAAAHTEGWPIAKGGSGSIARALAAYFISIGGKIELNTRVQSLQQLPSCDLIFFDTDARQLLRIAGDRFTALYNRQLSRFRFGSGVFKIDWALSGEIPFTDPACRKAGTVHLGNSFEDVVAAEKIVSAGQTADKPFVLLSQPTILDRSRAPVNNHIAWAYCHVPAFSTKDMTTEIEAMVERFAPGFRERILCRHVMNTAQLAAYDNNYVGGAINGGAMNVSQLFARPAMRLSPYRTPAKGIYICSASAPPGGGVHGMCGYYAARRALLDAYNIRLPRI